MTNRSLPKDVSKLSLTWEGCTSSVVYWGPGHPRRLHLPPQRPRQRAYIFVLQTHSCQNMLRYVHEFFGTSIFWKSSKIWTNSKSLVAWQSGHSCIYARRFALQWSFEHWWHSRPRGLTTRRTSCGPLGSAGVPFFLHRRLFYSTARPFRVFW